VIVIPVVELFQRVGLTDNLLGLIAIDTTFTLPICTFLLRNFVRAIPIEVEEAALVDGASRLVSFRRIVLPLMRQGLVTAGVFAFILSWGEYLMALSLISENSKKTLPLALQTLFDRNTTAFGEVMAFGVLITVPVVLLFALLQRQLVSNLFSGVGK
jgi:ABC-type glycerol-3-phosphate transport system permease component